jgi:DNA-binding XRE family transcriptional regulator
MVKNPTRRPAPHEVFMRQEPQVVVDKDDLNRRVAGIVRRKREELDLTQAQLAAAANLSRTSVAFIEAAKQECGLATFVNLSLALGSEPHRLLEEVWRPASVDDSFAQKVLQKANR